MQSQANLFTRDDTFLGVCEAIGEDTGIPSNLLRVALAFALFFQPVAVIVGYLAMGLVIAVSRWIFPKPKPAAAPVAVAEPETIEAEPEMLPLAA